MNRKKKDTSPLGQMRSLIEELTHSGTKELDAKLLSSLRNQCKHSDDFVGKCYQIIMHHLHKNHSEVRYGAFLIIDDFFRRSHCFRELILADMQEFMELTIEINKDNPLPKPRFTAEALKKKALQAVHEWNQKFGSAYKKLSLAYKFLKNYFKVDFRELEIQSSIEHQRQLETERKKQEFLNAKAKKIFSEIEENESDIHQAITSMENCLSLLLPHPKDFFVDSEDVNDGITTVSREMKSDISKGMEIVDMEKPEYATNKETTKLKNDIDVMSEEIENSKDEPTSSESDEESDAEENINLREYGVLNPMGSIVIDLKLKPGNIIVTEENSDIVENARDLFVILSNRHLVDVKKWIQILTKSGSSDKLKSLIDLKQSIEALLKKYFELNLPAKKAPDDSDDSDTSDFEEVKAKEDFEENVVEPLPSTSKAFIQHSTKSSKDMKKEAGKAEWSIVSQENDFKDPTSVLSTYSLLLSNKKAKTVKQHEVLKTASVKTENMTKESIASQGSSASTSNSLNESRKSRLLSVAPKVPFDLDLYHWENEQVPSAVMMTSHPDSHNIWSMSVTESEECQIPKELSGSTRVIEFSGKFDPVKWTCRAPLTSGKLCPRQDRVKCPFHGLIVPRDETGKVCEVDGKMPVVLPEKSKVPDWQDPELLRDIESQIGIDLTIPEKGKRKKKQPRHPGLTDIKAAQNTTYNRLAKKIFKKATMKRVASTMDAIDHKKFRDKFGDQFNYS